MSTFEIKMPKLGESITEGTIIGWTVKVGDVVNEDDILFEVSTAKVSAEIPSPVAGKIVKILFNEGDTVPIGTVIALVEIEGEGAEESAEATVASPDFDQLAEMPIDQQSVEEKAPEKSEPAVSPAPPVATKMAKEEDEKWYSPVVIRLAQEAQISPEELNTIPGTGYLGRLSKKDIEHYIDQKKRGTKAATPAVDAKAATPAAPTVAGTPKPVVAATGKGGEEVIEMDRIRHLIADHMVMSKKVSPHVTTIVEVDVTKLVRWRDRIKDEFFRREGVKLTFMPAIVEATAKALVEFPYVNASVDGYNMVLKKRINIGIAVALDDGNLIVPVVHNADKLNINGLATTIDSLAAKARSNKLAMDDIQDGTFTITNFGSFKNIIGTPIINQPQVAILGVGLVEKKPAVIETPEGDVIAIRHKMYLSLSYDHRIVNGATGGAFVRRIADYLEDWNEDKHEH